MAIERADVIDFIKNMTVLELSELVKELENVLGVSAAAPTAVMAVAAGGGAAAEEAAEQTEFDVELTAAGDKKIQAIKVVREVTGLGLKEAKEKVEEAPCIIKEATSKEDAMAIKAKFEEVGASVTIK
jgi:large subunit ribosomal protein L7/L12